MKVKDYGSDNVALKEKLNGSISPQEIEAQLELINKNIINNSFISGNRDEYSKKVKVNQIKGKVRQYNEKNDIDGNKIKYNINSINKINNNIISLNNDYNKINNINCINNIDFDNNIIIINKHNLKELNNINKEIKNEKKNEFTTKKGEIINIFVNEKSNFNKDINNSFEYTSNKIFDNSIEEFGQIKSNSLFPSELISKFLEKKRNKNKDKNDYNSFPSFGDNPLQTLKDIQNNLIEQFPLQKNNMSLKQFKINQKNLREQNIILQNYIKTLPVLNCPETKIFKANQYYSFNKINDDKNINIFNKCFNKNIKNHYYYNNNIKEKEESEEETIDRHIKKKFINKKRNSSISKK